jgi:hypothetical protein
MTVHPIRPMPQQREPELTRKQLADMLQVSLRTIDKWTKAGMPSVRYGQRVRRYQASSALAWAAAAWPVCNNHRSTQKGGPERVNDPGHATDGVTSTALDSVSHIAPE